MKANHAQCQGSNAYNKSRLSLQSGSHVYAAFTDFFAQIHKVRNSGIAARCICIHTAYTASAPLPLHVYTDCRAAGIEFVAIFDF